MNRSTPKPRHGHLAPFLWSIVERSGLPHKVIAADVGISETRLSSRLYRPEPMVLGKVLAVAARCGATSAELERVRILDALDRGVLPIPDVCDEQRIAKALTVLEER